VTDVAEIETTGTAIETAGAQVGATRVNPVMTMDGRLGGIENNPIGQYFDCVLVCCDCVLVGPLHFHPLYAGHRSAGAHGQFCPVVTAGGSLVRYVWHRLQQWS
jgi:hypothetical protein